MAKSDPTRSIRHAIRTLIPIRPLPTGNRRLVRFLGLVIVSLLVVILALNLLASVGAPKNLLIVISLLWMALLCGGAPVVICLRARDEERFRRDMQSWESDPRRLAIERLNLDLAAGRMPAGLMVSDIFALDFAATDWRESRESLECLSWARGDLARAKDELRRRMDEAMTNLLAEAGAGDQLGPSPFLVERARNLFAEVASEANKLGKAQSPVLQLRTDDSLEDLSMAVENLRDMREARSELVESLIERIKVEGP